MSPKQPSPASHVAATTRQTRHAATAFDAAAARYDQHASVQHSVADGLLDHIARQALPPAPRILEIGCGTGILTRKLAARIPLADWTITDLAPAMLQQARRSVRLGGTARFQIMDGEHPQDPAPDARFDLICSSMAVQWFRDPGQGMIRLADLLAPGGCLAIAVPTRGTWAEWRAAHETLGLQAATIPFPSVHQLQAPAETFRSQLHTKHYIDECGSALNFLRHLRGIGATTPNADCRPLSVAQLKQVCAVFEQSGARCSYRIAFSLWRRRDGSSADRGL
ncbi:methyltransferase domain-containing protein [Castellaniella sp.]|uniref:methyltransferase domain-containing protein n=1 Tax=Castellaniella sp. TaxID=1955812 RepID=UPI003C721D10